MATLHLPRTRITRRVLENRKGHQPDKVTFGRFRKGLVRAFRFDLKLLAQYPANYWYEQYDAYNRGDRSRFIHDKTLAAFTWAEKAYNIKKPVVNTMGIRRPAVASP